MELRYRTNSAAHRVRLLRVDGQLVHKRYQLLQEKIRAWSSLDFSKVGSMMLGTYDGGPDNTPRISFCGRVARCRISISWRLCAAH